MATKRKDYIRNPVPAVFTELKLAGKVFATDTEGEFEYQNGTTETSEIKEIVFKCAPLVQVTIKATIGNEERTVLDQVYVKDIDYVMSFKAKDTDKTYTLNMGQYLRIYVKHDYVGNQNITVIVYKDKLIWNREEEEKE